MHLLFPWLPFLIPIALVGAYMALLFASAVLEKQDTSFWVPVRAREQTENVTSAKLLSYQDGTGDPSALPQYVLNASDAAYNAGFLFDKLVADPKAYQNKVLATIWFSPDRRILAVCAGGTVLKMPSCRTRLITLLKDGRVLVTADETDAGDQSGVYILDRIIHVTFDELLAGHRNRMVQHAQDIIPFPEESATDACLAVLKRRMETMIARGLAAYCDPDHLSWRYTPWGALRVCLNFWTQLGQAAGQSHRVNSKPMGTHHVVNLAQSVYERYERKLEQTPQSALDLPSDKS